jgi:hypothetical protein
VLLDARTVEGRKTTCPVCALSGTLTKSKEQIKLAGKKSQGINVSQIVLLPVSVRANHFCDRRL